MFDVVIFQDSEGREPLIEWLNGLRDERAVARISARIERLNAGLFGDSRPLEQGIQELRINYGSGQRIYYGRYDQQLVLLLCGGEKRTQRRDIRAAIKFWKEWKVSQ